MIKRTLLLAALSFSVAAEECPAVLDSDAKKLRSSESVSLCEAHKGEVLLIVNTASECGFTPQFEGLETLYQEYKDQGFTVLGFPSNDFFQEHKDAEKTAEVCYLNYGVTFPMYEESAVRGDDANPVFANLREQSDTQPKWNFYKYLVGRDGEVKAVFSSKTKPDDKMLTQAIKAQL